jgi:hypothetical protein
MTIDERLNDTHEWQTVGKPNEVMLSASAARRVHRLYTRAEWAAELHQAAQLAFQQALIEAFENAGLSMASSDRYSIDWRTSTVTLRPEEGPS